MDINIAIVHGTANASKLLDAIRRGEKSYHFIEIMGCPGGCVTGGGQPRNYTLDKWQKRAAGILHEDERKPLRESFRNPEIKQIYDEFLGAPLGHRSHELLHTTYTDRSAER